jgi:hypothetical protein
MKSKHFIATVITCVLAIAGSSPIMAISARAEEVQQRPNSDSQTEVEATEEDSETSQETDIEESDSNSDASETARKKVTAKKTEKLDGKKLEQCQKKQAGVVAKLHKMATQGTKQAEVFKKILDRVEQFQIDKNYPAQQDLYDKADAAYDEAIKLGDTTSEIPALADCAEGNVKAVVESFREEQKSQISALKTFRSAVNDYIVAVKTSAEKQTESN